MEVQKLNCPSCGAPIAIPEDLEMIHCASCGTALHIKRGEGYVALKMVEKVAQTIQESGKETQSAIREGTAVTRKELQRLQYGQELSMAEMRLTSLRGEIRNTQREKSSPVIASQIRDLRFQEFYVLEKIRELKGQLTTLNLANPEDDLAYLEEQMALLHEEIAVIQSIVPANAETRHMLDELNASGLRFAAKAFELRVKSIKAGLRSFRPGAEADHSLAGLVQQIDNLNQDLAELNRQPASKETAQVKTELQGRYNVVYKEWETLEHQRVGGLLQSLACHPAEDDFTALRQAYDSVQNDLRNLASMPPNKVIDQYRQQLQQRSNDLYRKMERLQKQAAKEAAQAVKEAKKQAAREAAQAAKEAREQAAREAQFAQEAMGTGASTETGVGSFFKQMLARLDGGAATAVKPAGGDLPIGTGLPRAPLPTGPGVYIRGIILGFISIAVLFFGSAMIYAVITPPKTGAEGTATNSPTIIPMVSIFLGYCIGAYLFFRQVAPKVRIFPPFPQEPQMEGPSSHRIGIMAGLALLGGVCLLNFTLIMVLPTSISGWSCLLLPVGLILAFFYGRAINRQIAR